MNKKLYTIIYLVVSSVINIITLLATIILLIAGATALLKYGFKLPEDHQAYRISILVSLVAGVVISFILNQKIATKVITRFNMDQKFEDNWFGRKKTVKGADGRERPVERRKTNMPDSVKLSDEEQEERSRWGDQ